MQQHAPPTTMDDDKILPRAMRRPLVRVCEIMGDLEMKQGSVCESASSVVAISIAMQDLSAQFSILQRERAELESRHY
jgi:hypothetical protein